MEVDSFWVWLVPLYSAHLNQIITDQLSGTEIESYFNAPTDLKILSSSIAGLSWFCLAVATACLLATPTGMSDLVT